MSTYHYDRITLTFEASGECPVCGKRTKRSRTFGQTVNPFNRNEDGTVKTSREVYQAVKAEGEAWEPDFSHAKCARPWSHLGGEA